MPKITVTTRTKAEIDALFESVFRDVKPLLRGTPLTQEQRLAPYRKAILKQRRRGVSWLQIAHAMADPRIGERVSDKLLRRVFGAADPVRRSGRKPAGTTDACVEATAEARTDVVAEACTEPPTEASAEARQVAPQSE